MQVALKKGQTSSDGDSIKLESSPEADVLASDLPETAAKQPQTKRSIDGKTPRTKDEPKASPAASPIQDPAKEIRNVALSQNM